MDRPATRRVTANLPQELLEQACRATGGGVTETLVAGLELLRRARAAQKATRLKGKLHLDINLAAARERARR